MVECWLVVVVKVAVDAMGGDNAPVEIVKGTIEKLNQRKDFSVIFTGPEDAIRAELEKYTFDKEKVEVVNATEVISMDEHPVEAIKKKKDSSMVVGQLLLKEKKSLLRKGNNLCYNKFWFSKIKYLLHFP